MNKAINTPVAPVAEITNAQTEQKAVHPMQKSYTFVSKKHVDYDNLSAFEAVSMTAVFLLAITVGATAMLS